MMDSKKLICNIFSDNTCLRQPLMDFDEIDVNDSEPGELEIETLWRLEAKRSFTGNAVQEKITIRV